MRTLSQFATLERWRTVQSLRDEARLLSIAGVVLLGLGLAATLVLVNAALSPDGLSPMLPAAVGAPPLMLGYIACHYASKRLLRAKSLEARS